MLPGVEDSIRELLSQAKDGNGLPVKLFSGNLTLDNLKTQVRLYMEVGLDDRAVFIDMKSPGYYSWHAEEQYWKNLALLSEAIALAVRDGR
jgi:hypothetical protein